MSGREGGGGPHYQACFHPFVMNLFITRSGVRPWNDPSTLTQHFQISRKHKQENELALYCLTSYAVALLAEHEPFGTQ